MATVIPRSVHPLVFDTLPAVKVRFYTGTPQVYCYARFYGLGDALCVSLCVFEREPAPTSHVGFVYDTGSGPQYLWLSPEACGQGRVTLPLTPQQAQTAATAEGPSPERFAGQDEQGWYWGAVLRIPGFADITDFTAAVCQYNTGTGSFGLSGEGVALKAGTMQPFTFTTSL